MGSPLISNQAYSTIEPDSSIVVISSASFALVNPDGQYYEAKNGLASFTNPSPGNYKLNILTKSNNTFVAVAQFLPDGKVKYKEFSLKGIGPKFKTIHYDPGDTSEDIEMW